MDEFSEKNNLTFALYHELANTTDKFKEKYPENDLSVVLGAGIIYLTSFLSLAPTKEEALVALDFCVEQMRGIINNTPDNFFGGGIRKHFNQNQN